MVLRQILGAFAGCNNIEPCRPRPLNELDSESRLIAVSHRIHDACLPGFFGQNSTGKDIGFDVDHHDVCFARDRHLCVRNPSEWIAGGFNQHINSACVNHGLGAIEKRSLVDEVFAPADVPACLSRAVRIQISDGFDFKSNRSWHLAQEHGSEFSGSDQSDLDWSLGSLDKVIVNIHCGCFP